MADLDLDAIASEPCIVTINGGTKPLVMLHVDRRDALVAEVDRLRAENDALRRLASGRERLLACYRVGTQRGSGTALDMISKAQRDLDALGSDRG